MNYKITTITKINDNVIMEMRIDKEDYISLTDLVRYKNLDEKTNNGLIETK